MYLQPTPYKSSIVSWTCQMPSNPQRIDLPCSVDRVGAVRVKSVVWDSPPVGNETKFLTLSCPEFLIHTPSQSAVLMPGPSNGNQIVNRRDIIATWQMSKTEANIPNWLNPDLQPWIYLPKLLSINKLTLSLEDIGSVSQTEYSLTAVTVSQHVTVTLEMEVFF